MTRPLIDMSELQGEWTPGPTMSEVEDARWVVSRPEVARALKVLEAAYQANRPIEPLEEGPVYRDD